MCPPIVCRTYDLGETRVRLVRSMQTKQQNRTGRGLVAVLALLLVACGGGPGAENPTGSTNASGGLDSGGAGNAGMVLPPFDATQLNGGVLATFAVGSEKFRGWFTRAENTQRLVDAFAGTGAPVNSICMRLRQGAGAAQHNAPWTWSVDTLLPSDFDGNCPTCAGTWPLPSVAEGAINGPSRWNCTFQSGNATGVESRAFMQVTLLDVIDRR